MRKLLPFILALFGLAAGGGAGFLLRPPPDDMAEINPCGEPDAAAHDTDTAAHDAGAAEVDPDAPPTHEYVKLNNQFVVPVVEDGEVAAMVILSISLEVSPGSTEKVYAREPKLRDLFLQVLFDHANSGGFRGAFTKSNNMDVLRSGLREVAKKAMGAIVSDVLIVDIVRQDT